MIEVIQIFLVTCGIIFMELIVNYWTIIPLIILGICAYFIKIVYIKTVQSIKRYEGICKYNFTVFKYCHTSFICKINEIVIIRF